MTGDRIRIFVSSTSDMTEARERTRRVLAQLAHQYAGYLDIEGVFWEAMTSSSGVAPQVGIESIANPAQCDVLLGLLGARIGTPLPSSSPDRVETGTTREIRAALDAHDASRATGATVPKPEVFLFVSTRLEAPPTELAEGRRYAAQLQAALAFVAELEERVRVSPLAEAEYGPRTLHRFRDVEELERRLHSGLGHYLDRCLARADVGTPPAAGPQRAPFPGFRAYDIADSRFFRGRDGDIAEILRRLDRLHDARRDAPRRPAFLPVVGASGIGKSSLVRAGVLPELLRRPSRHGVHEILYTVVRPRPANDADPRTRLQSALHAVLDLGGERDAHDVGASAAAWFAGRVEEKLISTHRALVIVIDQLEEVADAAWDDFAKLVATMARVPGVFVIATIRSDFFEWYLRSPYVGLERPDDAGIDHFTVLPPTIDSLREMVQRPAAIAAVDFEVRRGTGGAASQRLDDLIIQEALRMSGGGETNEERVAASVMPQLQYLLQELFDRREGARLTFAAYEAVGGIRGALVRRADDAVASLVESGASALDGLFAAVVSVPEAQRPAVGRRASLSELTAPPARRLVDALVAARVVVVDGEGETRTVELGHESLLTQWRPAAEWVERHRTMLSIAERLRAAADRWHQRDRDAGLLWSSEVLHADVVRLLDRHAYLLTRPVDRSFAEASTSVHRRGVLLRWAAAVAVVLIALIMAGLAVRARDAAAEAEQRRREAVRTGAWEVASRVPQDAWTALHALSVERVEDEDRALLQRLRRGPLEAAKETGAPVRALTSTDDGLWVATGDRLELVHPHTLTTLGAHRMPFVVRDLVVSRRGRVVALDTNRAPHLVPPADVDLTVPPDTADTTFVDERLYFLAGDQLWVEGSTTSLLAVSDARRIAGGREDLMVAYADGVVRRFVPAKRAFDKTFSGCRCDAEVMGDGPRMAHVARSDDERWMATAQHGATGTCLCIWDEDDATRPTYIGSVDNAAIHTMGLGSHDGWVLAAPAAEGVIVVDASGRTYRLDGHGGATRAIAVGGAGETVFTGGLDNTLRRHRFRRSAPPRRGHGLRVCDAGFLGEDHVLSVGIDDRPRRWDRRGREVALGVDFPPGSGYRMVSRPVRIAGLDYEIVGVAIERRVELFALEAGSGALSDAVQRIVFGTSIATDWTRGHAPATTFAVEITSDPPGLWIGDVSGYVRAWQLTPRSLEWSPRHPLPFDAAGAIRASSSRINEIAVSEDGRFLAVAFQGDPRTPRAGTVAVFDVHRDFAACDVTPQAAVGDAWGVDWSHEGDLAASWGGGVIASWSSSNVRRLFESRCRNGEAPPKVERVSKAGLVGADRLRFAPRTRMFALATEDGSVGLFDADLELINKRKLHEGFVNCVTFDVAGERLVTCGDDATVRVSTVPGLDPLWSDDAIAEDNAPRGEIVAGRVDPVGFESFPGADATASAQLPYGVVAVGFTDGSFGLWETHGRRLLELSKLHGPVRTIRVAEATREVCARTELRDEVCRDISALFAPDEDVQAAVADVNPQAKAR